MSSHFDTVSPLVLNSHGNEEDCRCDAKSSSMVMRKFDPQDIDLEGLFENNKKWSAAVRKADPNFFSDIAHVQQPKLLWIGKTFKRVKF
jgi:hypothetical protein